MKRATRAGVEDRWHRQPRKGEEPSWPTDDDRPGCWCVDAKHAPPATLVTTVRHGEGRRWLARWVDHDGRERSKAFARKAEAQYHVGEVTATLTMGTYADPKRSAVMFRDVAEEWFAGKSGEPKTLAGYRSLLDGPVFSKWGDSRLRDIDHAGVQRWVTWLRECPDARLRPLKVDDDYDGPLGLSAARTIQAFQVVDQVLTYAIRARYIAANPADGVQLPRKDSRRDKAITHQELAALAVAAGELSTAVYVLGYGGMRFSELAALRIRDVDVQRGRLRISRKITYVTGRGYVEGPPKTHAERSVPLSPFVMDMVAEAIKGREPSEFVFPVAGGGFMPLDYFRWRFDKACASAGLTEVTPKTLRHTSGSLALASGQPVMVAQKLLGHKKATTTMDVYAHDLPDGFDSLAAAMDAAAREALKPPE